MKHVLLSKLKYTVRAYQHLAYVCLVSILKTGSYSEGRISATFTVIHLRIRPTKIEYITYVDNYLNLYW